MNNWKKLKENCNYEVNKNGAVRNLKTKHILKPAKIKNGYLTINLSQNGNGKTYLLHRIVANNFINNPNNYREVNHIDGNKLNNNVDNLEWCDRSYNLKHAYDNNLKIKRYGENNPASKKVKQTNLETKEIIIWDSMMDIKRKLNYSTGSISDACQGKLKTAYKSKWEYV